MPRFSISTLIDATPSRLWDICTQPEEGEIWDPEGPLRVGTRIRSSDDTEEIREDGPWANVTRCVALDDGFSYTIEYWREWLKVRSRIWFLPQGGGTKVMVTARCQRAPGFYGILPFSGLIMYWAAIRSAKSDLRAQLVRLKEKVEASKPPEDQVH